VIDIPRDLPPFGHVGYIVEDIDTCVDGFRRALGAGDFRVYDYVPLRAWAYGRPLSPCRLRIGIDSVGGHLNIELIQPVEGATLQARFLRDKGPGLHHVAFYSERYEEWLDRFRQRGAEIGFEAEAEDEINGYRRSFYAEVAGMPGIVEISEIALGRGGKRT
jgi:catechol 2,3-dioxygenase-like lactoylglutathione lyase family enzyme